MSALSIPRRTRRLVTGTLLAALAAAVVARHEHRLVEPHGAIEAPRGFVAGTKLEVNAGDAGAARRFQQPPGSPEMCRP